MGIREGLMLREYIDTRQYKIDELKNRAQLYKQQAEGMHADTLLKMEEYLNAKRLQDAMRQQFPEMTGGGSAPAAAPRRYSGPLESMLTQYQSQGADVSVEPPPPQTPPRMGTTLPTAPAASAPLDLSGTSPGQERKQAVLSQTPAPAPPPDIPAAKAPAPSTSLPPAYTSLDPQTRQRVDTAVATAAKKYHLQPAEIYGLMGAESNFNVHAVSPKGAIGPMQLMPDTARMLGVNPHVLEENIDGGARYYAQQKQTYGGDVAKARAAYNAGPGTVNQYGGVPPYQETREHGARAARYEQRFLGQEDPRVAGPGAPQPAPPVTGGLETPPVAAAPQAPPPVDPQLVKFDRLRQLGKMMVYFGKANAGNQWIQNINSMEEAYRKQQEMGYLREAALANFTLQTNPALTDAQKLHLAAQRDQALIKAGQVTNARQYSELQPVAAGTTMLDPTTRQPAYTSPYRPMAQPEGTQIVQPPQATAPSGTPATVVSPAPPKTVTPKDYGQMPTNQLIDLADQGDERAARILKRRQEYEAGTTGGRAGAATTERIEATETAKRGQTLEVAKGKEAQKYFTPTGERVNPSANYGETQDKMGRGEVIYVPDADDADQVTQMRQALVMANTISRLTQKVYGPGGIFEKFTKAGRGSMTYKGGFARFAQSDTDYSVLQRQLTGLAEKFGRAYTGTKGVQTEGDVTRNLDLVTRLTPIPDRPEVAYGLINEIYDNTENVMRILLERPDFAWSSEQAKRPPRTGQPPAPAAGPAPAPAAGQTAPGAGQTAPPGGTTPPLSGPALEDAVRKKYNIPAAK